jgi:hypothetical protein
MLRTALAAAMIMLGAVLPAQAAQTMICQQGWMMSMNTEIKNQAFTDQHDPDDLTPIPKWCTEGPMSAGIDRNQASALTKDNAYLQTATPQWNAMRTYMLLPGRANYRFAISGFVRTEGPVSNGYFGVRAWQTPTVYKETRFGASVGMYSSLLVKFCGRNDLDGVTIFAGHWSPNVWTRVMFDDPRLVEARDLGRPCTEADLQK